MMCRLNISINTVYVKRVFDPMQISMDILKNLCGKPGQKKKDGVSQGCAHATANPKWTKFSCGQCLTAVRDLQVKIFIYPLYQGDKVYFM